MELAKWLKQPNELPASNWLLLCAMLVVVRLLTGQDPSTTNESVWYMDVLWRDWLNGPSLAHRDDLAPALHVDWSGSWWSLAHRDDLAPALHGDWSGSWWSLAHIDDLAPALLGDWSGSWWSLAHRDDLAPALHGDWSGSWCKQTSVTLPVFARCTTEGNYKAQHIHI